MGLYGIVVGLALLTPLESLASDILTAPLAGDWGLRFIALGLFAEAAIWFHALTAEMALEVLDEEGDATTARSGALPGMSGPVAFRSYYRALTDFWLGAGVVVFLVLLAQAVPRGVHVFLWTFVAYTLWDALWEAVYLARHRADSAAALREFRTPAGLVRRLIENRRLPATTVDVRRLVEGSPAIELMWARTAWYWLLAALVIAAWTAGLAWVASAGPHLTNVAALGWFVAVVLAIGLDYWFLPHYYTA